MAGNRLRAYREKRDFSATSEPRGRVGRKKKGGLSFAVQKHDARRLHYDFRLEWDGVLLSWAVPKGPSYDPADRRLAMRTEDHPLSYGEFEGIIPAHQYGAGPVMLWDAGTWVPLDDDPDKALAKGHLRFRLEGEKLRGEWTLSRMSADEAGRESWLLIKRRDGEEKRNESFLKEMDYSVKSGRSLKDISAANGGAGKSGFKKLEEKYRSPQLAMLADVPPRGENWIHEVKYDGYRIFVFVSNGDVRIRTRRFHDWTERFPALRDAFADLKAGSFVLDGEAVILNERGISDFKALQNALDQNKPVQGYFFDLLYRNGEDYTHKPFSERRRALEELFYAVPRRGPIYISEILKGDAGLIFQKACALGLEGIVSKRLDTRYIQKRTRSWIKIKCEKRQEFIICGFVPAGDHPRAIGALHLGYYQDGGLCYAGKVGTGFDTKTAEALYQKLAKLEIEKPPFGKKPEGTYKGTVWVTPDLICEVKFAMWTAGGKVRHASFQGLRADKKPEQITREEPEHNMNRESRNGTIQIKGVKISHAEREIFPKAKITKGELVQFYAELAELIMPMIANRPISIVRCPGGIGEQCFFQRSKGKGMGKHIYTIDIRHEEKKHDYMYLKNITGLIELVQMGGIEIHPWGVKIDKTDKPDRIVFDLDPGEGVPFEAVKLAAQDIRRGFEGLGLQSFLKCTGGKGLHVTVPIVRRHGWDAVKDFSRNFARRMEERLPDVYTTNMAKKKREGKIFIDYLRNDFSSTAVMDYCVRARPGAAVAVPLEWGELESLVSASQFTMAEAVKRQKTGRRILQSYQGTRQNLTKSILKKTA